MILSNGMTITAMMFAYLLIQSWIDAKTMQVFVILNNTALALSIALYAIDCFLLREDLSWEVIGVALLIVMCSVLGLYGIGDAKAMITIYLSLRYWHASYPHPDVLAFLVCLLFANGIFLLFYNIKSMAICFKTKASQKIGKSQAYFPFLTIGYAISVALGALNRF